MTYYILYIYMYVYIVYMYIYLWIIQKVVIFISIVMSRLSSGQ